MIKDIACQLYILVARCVATTVLVLQRKLPLRSAFGVPMRSGNRIPPLRNLVHLRLPDLDICDKSRMNNNWAVSQSMETIKCT